MRPLVALAVALCTLAATAGCGPEAMADRPVHCAIIGNSPARDNDEAPKRIVAGVRFWCDDPGANKITLTVRLQRRNSKGHWVDVVKKTFSAKKAKTTRPDDPDERYRTWSVSAPCREGDFRTVVTGSYTSRGETKKYESIGVRANNPCRPTIFT